MSYHGVFFDFDYTLGDSTSAIAEGYRLGFLELGLDPPTVEQVRHTVGLTLADGYSLLTGDHDPERQEAFYRSFQHTVGVKAGGEGRRLMIEGTTLFPGAEEQPLQGGDGAFLRHGAAGDGDGVLEQCFLAAEFHTESSLCLTLF